VPEFIPSNADSLMALVKHSKLSFWQQWRSREWLPCRRGQ